MAKEAHWMKTFKGGSNGSEPFTGVILDMSGHLYGTTTLGGAGGNNGGIVFKLTAANGYAKSVLHNFNRLTDPSEDFPNAVTFDASGNLWGMTEYAIFKLSPETSGWTETWVFNWQNTPGWSTAFTPRIVDSHGVPWARTLGELTHSRLCRERWKLVKTASRLALTHL